MKGIKYKLAVLKNLRKLSSMEFYKTAINIRKSITEWLLKDFGVVGKPFSVKRVIKNIDEEDEKIIDDIFLKYGVNPNKQFQNEYPEWFVDFERDIIIKILHEMIANITSANSIYAVHDFEFDLRREYQDKAITNFYQLYQELQYITSIFKTDLNKYVEILDLIDKEVDLIKGWRQSDNKKRK